MSRMMRGARSYLFQGQKDLSLANRKRILIRIGQVPTLSCQAFQRMMCLKPLGCCPVPGEIAAYQSRRQ
jgi:hypothetical protein